MTRPSFQRGYVSNAMNTRNGIAFLIRYRIAKADGKCSHKSETLHGLMGKKEAREVLSQRIKESTNRCVSHADLTVEQFVDSFWRPYLDRKNVKPSTCKAYDSTLRLYVLPILGSIRVSDVSPLHIGEIVNSRLKAGSSPKTTRNLVGLLQCMFSLAVDNDMIPRSPVRQKHKPAMCRTEKTIWTAEQVQAIVNAVPATYCVLFKLIALTGARLGEVLGLQWKHVDLQSGKVHIHQSLWGGQLQTPKTARSIRTISLGVLLCDALADHRTSSLHIELDDFVFCKADGLPFHPDVLRKDVLYPALDRCKILRSKRSSGFHAFRHTAASIINSKTGNMKLAQHLLGHATLSMTADTYTHVSDDDVREAGSVLEEAIFGNLFQDCSKLGTGTSNTTVN